MLKEIAPGTHAVLIYDSLARKRQILFSHLAMGLEDSKLAYICSEETPEKIEREMIDYGFDVMFLKETGRLTILSHGQAFVNDQGRLDVGQAIGHLSHLAWSCRKENLDGGLRVAQEMSSFVRDKTSTGLALYEKRLHRTFFFHATGICAYSRADMHSSGNLEGLLAMLHTKDRIVLTGPNGIAILEPEEIEEAPRLII